MVGEIGDARKTDGHAAILIVHQAHNVLRLAGNDVDHPGGGRTFRINDGVAELVVHVIGIVIQDESAIGRHPHPSNWSPDRSRQSPGLARGHL